MYRLLPALWNLAAVGGAVAVGITTHDAGFTAITFIGGLTVPRMLGLAGPGLWGRRGPFAGPGRFGVGPAAAGRFGAGGWRGGCFGGGRGGADGQRWEEWHRQSHEAQPTPPVEAA